MAQRDKKFDQMQDLKPRPSSDIFLKKILFIWESVHEGQHTEQGEGQRESDKQTP